MASYWGIDLGGTKIEGVVLSKADASSVKCRIRVPTEKEHGYEHIIGQLAKLINLMAEEIGEHPEKIGIGTPGAIDPGSRLMKNSNTTVLNGMPLRDDLAKALGIPVIMANDANCFALAEALMGAVPEVDPDAEVVFGVIMGTGVGGGIVVRNKIINGKHGIAGEWGHNYLDKSGGDCYCGRVGCVETILSGPNLERYYHEISGERPTLKEIVERHYAGRDPFATQTMEHMIAFFGKAMGPIINSLDPDVIVLGGGVSNIELLYQEGVKEIAKYVFNPNMQTTFLHPKLGDSAGVFGAAMLVV